MIIQFPHGHSYDFQRIVAGLTALLNQTPTRNGDEWATWEPRDAMPQMPTMGTPPLSVYPKNRQPRIMFTTFTVSAAPSLSSQFQVQVRNTGQSVDVEIPWGLLDPINEVVGYWRYGTPSKNEQPFEIK
jgi:hypothetical protein